MVCRNCGHPKGSHQKNTIYGEVCIGPVNRGTFCSCTNYEQTPTFRRMKRMRR